MLTFIVFPQKKSVSEDKFGSPDKTAQDAACHKNLMVSNNISIIMFTTYITYKCILISRLPNNQF